MYFQLSPGLSSLRTSVVKLFDLLQFSFLISISIDEEERNMNVGTYDRVVIAKYLYLFAAHDENEWKFFLIRGMKCL